jgi:hypothetical protein
MGGICSTHEGDERSDVLVGKLEGRVFLGGTGINRGIMYVVS